MNLFRFNYNSPCESDYISPRLARLGLTTGLFIYSIYGFLDLFMLPEHFKIAITIRYLIIAPSVAVYFALTYYPKFMRVIRFWLSLMLIFALGGITAILMLASPDEGAIWTYFIGYILITLWAAFIFRLKTRFVVFLSILSLLLFNLIMFGYHQFYIATNSLEDLGMIINNNYLIVSCSVLTIVGASSLEHYRKKHDEKNRQLIKEKQAYRIARDKAQESDRLKTAFLSNMSHEIRTPLNAILGFSELLRMPGLGEMERNQFTEIINDKGEELLQRINDIIDISKIEANQIEIREEPFDANELIDSMRPTYESIMSKTKDKDDLRLLIKIPEENKQSLTIISDKTRLKQILDNLLTNAIKFTESGYIEIGYYIENGIIFFVRDTGIGIPEDKIDVVFDRFTKIEDDISTIYGGTGLGLNIVKNLIELLNGKVTIESEHGNGSTFYIHLPANSLVSQSIAN